MLTAPVTKVVGSDDHAHLYSGVASAANAFHEDGFIQGLAGASPITISLLWVIVVGRITWGSAVALENKRFRFQALSRSSLHVADQEPLNNAQREACLACRQTAVVQLVKLLHGRFRSYIQ